MTDLKQGATVLITGGCGYLGSQLIRDFAQDTRFGDITVRILDNMQQGDYRSLMNLPIDIEYQFIEGDIMDPGAVRKALEGVDAVVHLAAVVRTPLSFDHPAWTEQVNHWGTARLVEHCLEANVTRFVLASSASVYGPGGPFSELEECHPIGPYAQSKHLAERAVLVAIQRNLQPTVLRLGTFFGYAPTMRFLSVPNRFSYLAGVGRPLTVLGSGKQTRPFLHVRDASKAIRICLENPRKSVGETYNVVGCVASVLDLVEAVRLSKPDIHVLYTEQDMLTRFTFAAADERIRSLDWSPDVTLEEGMAETIGLFHNISLIGNGALIKQEIRNWE